MRTLAAVFGALGVAAAIGAAATPAHAEADDWQGWRQHQWRTHEGRDHARQRREWRERQRWHPVYYGHDYFYVPPVSYAAPAYYAVPAVSFGMTVR